MLAVFATLDEKHIPDRMVKLIYGAFTASAAIGVVVLALLRPAPDKRIMAGAKESSAPRISALKTLSMQRSNFI